MVTSAAINVVAAALGVLVYATVGEGAQTVVSHLIWPRDSVARKTFLVEFKRTGPGEMSAEQLADMAWAAKTWLFNTMYSMSLAVAGEVLIKYPAVMYARLRRKPLNDRYVDYTIEATTGFVFAMLSVCSVSAFQRYREASWLLAVESAEWTVSLVAEICLGAVVGLRATGGDYLTDERKGWAWWRVCAPGVAVQTATSLAVFAARACKGDIGWKHPTVLWGWTG